MRSRPAEDNRQAEGAGLVAAPVVLDLPRFNLPTQRSARSRVRR